MRQIDFRILGPLEARENGTPLALGGAKQRALLAMLLLHAGKAVSTDRLLDALWGERPPRSALNSVHVYVSMLRKTLGDERLVTSHDGYALDIDDAELDLGRFEVLVREARVHLAGGETAAARDQLAAALGLWRGPALPELAHTHDGLVEVGRLEDLRLAALEEKVGADLELGTAEELVPELEGLVSQHPLRERLRYQLMLALYQTGRQADALEVYRRGRRVLAELGLDPDPALQELEHAILNHDPALERTRTPSPVARRRRGPLLLAGAAALLLVLALGAATRLRGGDPVGLGSLAANSVGVIDPGSNRIVAQVPVGIRPGAITVGASSVWVANLGDRSLSRINPVSKGVVRTIPLASPPTGLAADTRRVWVVSGSSTDSGELSTVDPEFNSLRSRSVPATDFWPNVSPSAARAFGDLWVVDWDGLVLRLDPKTENVLATVAVGNAPTAIAAGAGALWVANTDDGTVSRIDPTNVVTATIPVGHGPSAIAVGAGAVWVTEGLDGDLVRIDPTTNAATSVISVGGTPSGVAAGRTGVWVVDSKGEMLVRVDPTTTSITAKIPLGRSPQGIALVDGRPWVTVTQPLPTPSGTASALHVNLESDPGTPDPALAVGPVSGQLFYATCAKLLNYPDKPAPAGSQLEPEVAEVVPAPSASGKSYTFRIRPGFRFSPPSNEPVTAETFKNTIERTLSPKLHNGYTTQLVSDIAGERAFESGKAGHISGIVAHNNTLKIRLTRIAPDFLARIALPAFCAVPTNTPIDPAGVPTVPTAGPYFVAAYVPHREIILKKNPNYQGSRPRRFAEIVYTIGVSKRRTVSQVEAGSTDYAGDGVPAQANARLAARYGPRAGAARAGRPQYDVDPVLSTRFLALNTSRPLFANPRLRSAVNYAIDRPALVAQEARYFSGAGTVNDEYLPPGFPGYPHAHVYPLQGPDIKTAGALAAGTHGTAVLYTCNQPPCPQDAQIITRNLKRIGIDVETKMFTAGVFYERVSRRREPFDIATIGWTADYPDPSNFLNLLLDGRSIARENNVDFSYFDDPTFNRKLEAAALLPAPQRYRTYAALAIDLAKNAAPWVVIENDTSRDFLSARIGCQVFQPVYGIDLAALCLRP